MRASAQCVAILLGAIATVLSLAFVATELGWRVTGVSSDVSALRIGKALALFMVASALLSLGSKLSTPETDDYLRPELQGPPRPTGSLLDGPQFAAAIVGVLTVALLAALTLAATLSVGWLVGAVPWWLAGAARPADAVGGTRDFLLGVGILVLAGMRKATRPALRVGPHVVEIPRLYHHQVCEGQLCARSGGELVRVDPISGEVVHRVRASLGSSIVFGFVPSGAAALAWEADDESWWRIDVETGVATELWKWRPGLPRIKAHRVCWQLHCSGETTARLVALCTAPDGTSLGLRRVEVDLRRSPDDLVRIVEDSWNDQFLVEAGHLSSIHLGPDEWMALKCRKGDEDFLHSFNCNSGDLRLVDRAAKLSRPSLALGGQCAYVREDAVMLCTLGSEAPPRSLERGRFWGAELSPSGCWLLANTDACPDNLVGHVADDYRLSPVAGLLSGACAQVLDGGRVLARYQGNESMMHLAPIR